MKPSHLLGWICALIGFAMPMTASAQDLERAAKAALASDVELQLAEYDNQFESALSDYRQDVNGYMALVYDMFSTALNNTREQIDRGKDDPSTDELWANIAEKEAMDLVGQIPYVGSHLTKVIDAKKAFDEKTAKIQEQRAIGTFLVSQQEQGADQRTRTYVGSNKDPRLTPIRERYQELRDTLKDKLVYQAEKKKQKITRSTPGSSSQQTRQDQRFTPGTPGSAGSTDPCQKTGAHSATADLHLAVSVLEGTTDVNAAKKDILLLLTSLRNVTIQEPGKAMRTTMELGMLSGYYNSKGALFSMDLNEGKRRMTLVIRSKDISQSTYTRTEKLINQTGEVNFPGGFEPPPVWSSEGFDIPVLVTEYKIVPLDTSKSLLRIPAGNSNSLVAPKEEQAWHNIVLPDHWSAAEKRSYLKAHPEYRRMSENRIREVNMTSNELKAIKDHYGPLNSDILRSSSKGTELKATYQGL
jgi:hypothetical protein